MRLRTALALATLAIAAVLALACGGDDAPPRAPASPTPVVGQTGIGEVDVVIRAVQAHDVDTLLSAVAYTTVECIPEPQGSALPICSSIGMPVGSTVETLPIVISHGVYVLKSQVPAFFRERLNEWGLEFYGVLTPEERPFFRGSKYAVVFKETRVPARLRAPSAPPSDEFLALHLRDGNIVAVEGFGTGARDLPAPNDAAWVIPPKP